jgi:hypothetical protein
MQTARVMVRPMRRPLVRPTLVRASLVLLFGVAAGRGAAALAAPNPAGPSSQRLTLTVQQYSGGSGHGYVILPTKTSLRELGPVVASGSIEGCSPTYFAGLGASSPCPRAPTTTVRLTVRATGGDSVTLSGKLRTGASRLAWSVVAGTGRFSRASGSGQLVLTYPGNSGRVLVALITGRLAGVA